MASGLPLVAPDSGGVTTYANRDNAWIVPAAPESFGGAIQRILADREDRDQRVRRARRTAEEFAWPVKSANFFSLYRDLCARGQSDEMAFSESPAFCSTRGDWLGFEIAGRESRQSIP